VRERDPRRAVRRPAVEKVRPDPREVVGGALGLAAARPRDDGAVAGADELLELGLGVLQRARRGVGGLGAERVRLVAGDARQAQRGACFERGGERVGRDVEMVGVGVVEARRDVLPEVA
jgi:hypothetical protein